MGSLSKATAEVLSTLIVCLTFIVIATVVSVAAWMGSSQRTAQLKIKAEEEENKRRHQAWLTATLTESVAMPPPPERTEIAERVGIINRGNSWTGNK